MMHKFHHALIGATLIAALVSTCLGVVRAQIVDHHVEVDTSIKPGDDFYGYANTAWLRATPLPDGVSRMDSTSMLRAENARRVQHLIEDAVAQSNPSHSSPLAVGQKVANFYSSWLDTATIDSRGLAPLAADLADIQAIDNRRKLAAYLGRTTRLDDGTNAQTESLWGVWIHQGFHDPDHYAAHVVQGGLTLADDDYLNPAPEHTARRELYRTHIAAMLRAAQVDQPDTRAARVLSLETAIAATHASRADTDDVFKTDNTWRRADFAARAPGVNWDAYFNAARLTDAPSFVVWQPQALIGGARIVASQSLEAWRDYFTFHLIAHYAAVLPAEIRDEQSAFEAQLAGAPVATPARAAEANAATQAALGDAIGRLYVARYFSPQAKAAAQDMLGNIRTAFRARFSGLTWMAPETRTQALAKLEALHVGLGYPETWIDYAPLTITRGDAYGNLRRVEAFTYARETAKLSRRVDPNEWPMGLHPHMVSAILDLSPNSMEFAAGLLQPPYFDPTGDPAANYGSAGAGMSHEISHSFDEVSNMYDARGRLTRWWTADDATRFHAVLATAAAQLDSCCPAPNLCAHGPQIAAESAADLAGLNVAHDAYLLSLHGRLDVVINGLTGKQRFFIAYAQRWRRQQTSADLQHQIATDNHAPPHCRSNLVRNSDAWANAFGIHRGDALYVEPSARIRYW